MTRPTLDILRDARALVAREGGWMQEWFARNSEGREVWPGDPTAVCFCARGAVWHVNGQATGVADDYAPECVWPVVEPALLELATSRCLQVGGQFVAGHAPGFVVNFNDARDRSQAEVVALFDATIARLEAAA